MSRLRVLLLLLGLTAVTAPALHAQVGERRNNLAIGASAGWVMNRITFDPTIKQHLHMAPAFGVTVRYTSERYSKAYCALQLEVNYAQLGWREDISDSNNEPLPDTYERHLNYIQVPMLARLAWGREKRGLMGYVLAGPQIGYCIGESSSQSSSTQTTMTTKAATDSGMAMCMVSSY